MADAKVRPKKQGLARMCADWGWSAVVNGTLKGYDALMNLVLDDVQEVVRGMLAIAALSDIFLAPLTSLLLQTMKATSLRGLWAW